MAELMVVLLLVLFGTKTLRMPRARVPLLDLVNLGTARDRGADVSVEPGALPDGHVAARLVPGCLGRGGASGEVAQYLVDGQVTKLVIPGTKNDDPAEPFDDAANLRDDPLVGWIGLLGLR